MKVLLWLWQLPQNIIGFIISRFADEVIEFGTNDGTKKCYLFNYFFNSAVSLGDYIIIQKYIDKRAIVMLHEYGHSIQSKKYGWFYLLLVGLPSLICNIYDRVFHKNWTYNDRYKWYHSLLWECEADELGGIKK